MAGSLALTGPYPGQATGSDPPAPPRSGEPAGRRCPSMCEAVAQTSSGLQCRARAAPCVLQPMLMLPFFVKDFICCCLMGTYWLPADLLATCLFRLLSGAWGLACIVVSGTPGLQA